MLEPPERKALEQRIAAQPGQFVAQYPVAPSLNPRWDGEGLRARRPSSCAASSSPRATAIACCPAGWRANPRATRALRQLGRLNGTLKDVWVLAEDAADVQIPTSRRFHQLAVDRGSADLQSRVADNLYWLGRYIERLDNDARLLRTALTRVAQGVIGAREGVELRLLGRLLDRANLMPPSAALAMPESAAFQQGLTAVAVGRARPRHRARRHPARSPATLRDRFSPDMTAAVGPDDERGPRPAAHRARQSRSAAGGARRHRPLRRHAFAVSPRRT